MSSTSPTHSVEDVATKALMVGGARVRNPEMMKKRSFNFWQFVKQDGNHTEIVKERHPMLRFHMKENCPLCQAIYHAFAVRYDTKLVATHLKKVFKPLDGAELDETEGWWQGHDHAGMVTKLGAYALTVDLGLHDIRDLGEEQVSGTIAARISKRFPKKTRSGDKRITRETRKQKQFRVKWQTANWKKRYKPDAVALQKGCGSQFIKSKNC